MLRRHIEPYMYLIVGILLVPGGAIDAKQVDRHHSECEYQMEWCLSNGGNIEVVLEDKTRCDCVTKTHAIEIEFAKRWSHAIGQSLHYALKTGKNAGIVLVLVKPDDEKYLEKLKLIIKHHSLPITVWMIDDRKRVRSICNRERK